MLPENRSGDRRILGVRIDATSYAAADTCRRLESLPAPLTWTRVRVRDGEICTKSAVSSEPSSQVSHPSLKFSTTQSNSEVPPAPV